MGRAHELGEHSEPGDVSAVFAGMGRAHERASAREVAAWRDA